MLEVVLELACQREIFVENIPILENKINSCVRQFLLSFHVEQLFSVQLYYPGNMSAFQQNKTEP